MNAAITPATSLPWAVDGNEVVRPTAILRETRQVAQIYRVDSAGDADAAYIAHACNAFPKLVEDRRRLVEALRKSVLNHCADDKMFCSTCTPARALLRELGEGE